jgi:hypothetical protein
MQSIVGLAIGHRQINLGEQFSIKRCALFSCPKNLKMNEACFQSEVLSGRLYQRWNQSIR